jgi:hypothetical protein
MLLTEFTGSPSWAIIVAHLFMVVDMEDLLDWLSEEPASTDITGSPSWAITVATCTR